MLVFICIELIPLNSFLGFPNIFMVFSAYTCQSFFLSVKISLSLFFLFPCKVLPEGTAIFESSQGKNFLRKFYNSQQKRNHHYRKSKQQCSQCIKTNRLPDFILYFNGTLDYHTQNIKVKQKHYGPDAKLQCSSLWVWIPPCPWFLAQPGFISYHHQCLSLRATKI